jgi:hypothetical protein
LGSGFGVEESDDLVALVHLRLLHKVLRDEDGLDVFHCQCRYTIFARHRTILRVQIPEFMRLEELAVFPLDLNNDGDTLGLRA